MLKVKGVTKTFPGVISLDRVDFETQAGEIHALVGENGAGKSTLIKIIAGAYRADEGEIQFDNQVRHWSTPTDARAAGIHVIYQELVLFPELSVAENILVGHQPRTRFGLINRQRTHAIAAELLTRLGHQLDTGARVKDLSVADQQMVEIAKALVGDTKLLILDEPTAVISGHEVTLLFERMRTLKDAGVSIIYISHRLEEIFEIADRVTVLKDGQWIGTRPVSDISRDELIAMMVGRELADIYPVKIPTPSDTPVVLSVNGLHVGNRVKDVSFDVRRGEVLGLAGLVGAGRTDVAHAIFGSVPADAGEVLVNGEPITAAQPERAIARGIGFLTEDRKAEGLFLELDVAANVTAPALQEIAPGLLLDFARERAICQAEIDRFAIAARTPGTKIVGLSGGNQQKVLFSRWARRCDQVLILDEPTRGVDVGAKVEIYRIIRELADAGVAILMISSELPEIVGMCDRVIVMREGVKTGEVEGEAVTEAGIMDLATAHDDQAPVRAATDAVMHG